MEHGISSLRDIEKLCRNDIRFLYLLDGMKAPSFAILDNFIRGELTTSIEQIFNAMNAYIFQTEQVDLQHTYIDGTKLEYMTFIRPVKLVYSEFNCILNYMYHFAKG